MSGRPSDPASTQGLVRVVGVPGAVLLGLGSILGTGIFVSVGIAADIAGTAVVLAVALAAVVAAWSGLSSAQLAANHPVSGGTYEYGYRYLHPTLGFTAGWMFLCAKSASAATAALGFSGYILAALGRSEPLERVALGLAIVILLTMVVAGGMHRSNRTNAVIVGITLLALVSFVVMGLLGMVARGEALLPLSSMEDRNVRNLLHATALMFVAYTGYGRIATLGEEVHEPERNIPRAMVITLVLTMVLYVTVTSVAIGLVGAGGLAEATRAEAAPLESAARAIQVPGLRMLVAIGAVTAMAGVLLNLLLGLSRVLLAMARRGDMPRALAKLEGPHASPRRAVIVVGVLIGTLVSIGSVRTTWTFSAFTVLVYYAITNLSALRLPAEQRLYPRAIPSLGLASCLGLAFWVESLVWMMGLGVIAVGLFWHRVAQARDTPVDRDPSRGR